LIVAFHYPQCATSDCDFSAPQRTAEALIQYGALIVKDSRVSEQDNATFLDLLEDYFAQENDVLMRDVKAQFGYQVGATLENTEKPRCTLDTDCHRLIASLDPAERPLDLDGAHKDPKSRFFWRMNKNEQAEKDSDLPEDLETVKEPEAKYAVLKAPNVVPDAFKDVWKAKMEAWGGQMLTAVDDVNKMLAVGLNLPADSLTQLAK
jgi:isopenicillin N synthase-like dioxygenase